jgi:hypothetical protein
MMIILHGELYVLYNGLHRILSQNIELFITIIPCGGGVE